MNAKKNSFLAHAGDFDMNLAHKVTNKGSDCLISNCKSSEFINQLIRKSRNKSY